MSNQNRQLYIVISQTGTLLSRILKQITGAEYNHASISLSRDLERRKYSYNYIGLCLAYFHVVWKQEGCYYCSEFVGELLAKSRVDGTEQLRSSIIQPMQFLRMPHTLLYCCSNCGGRCSVCSGLFGEPSKQILLRFKPKT